MSVTFPRGFRAAAVAAGMKPSGRPDVGLLVADRTAAAAGLFTTNVLAAAPVRLSRARLARATAQALIVNSGQANAATGERGDRDAATITDSVARALGLDPDLVLACSTGVVGEPLHLEQLLEAVPKLVESLAPEAGTAFAEAIMTTDTRLKEARAHSGSYRVGGCAKGVGMIAPDLDLATLLVFVTTDAPIPPQAIGKLAKDVLEPKFESLSVDGCTSTNDTVLLLASGAAGGDPVVPEARSWQQVAEAVAEVGDSLLVQLAQDAEGADHVVSVDVIGAVSDEDARAVAKAVAGSLLVKAAIFGGDPNPGRILQAIGASGARIKPEAVEVRVGDVLVAAGGTVPEAYWRADGAGDARAAVTRRDVTISVSLGAGPGRSRALGVDLSYEYVRINAEYTT
ncbi:MAG: bifunctional glutamate N-acetyltransferase/amino-acid acetyltransferase ArgJ [Actinomycetota bacterium]